MNQEKIESVVAKLLARAADANLAATRSGNVSEMKYKMVEYTTYSDAARLVALEFGLTFDSNLSSRLIAKMGEERLRAKMEGEQK